MTSSSYDWRRLVTPLAAVSAVCHARLGLDALAEEISAFIAPTSHRLWTIELACERGHEQLLRQLVALEPADTNEFLRSHVFGKALVHAVRRDNLALLESLKTYCPTGFASWGMEEAAALGKVHLLEWLEANCPNIVWDSRIVHTAAAHGHIPALEWLMAYRTRKNDGRSSGQVLYDLSGAMEHAVKAGHFEAVQWLHENVNVLYEHEYVEYVIFFAALRSGRMEIVRYLYEGGYGLNQWDCEHPIDLVLKGGCSSLADLKWLVKNKFGRATDEAARVAAERGLTDIMRWMLKRGMVARDPCRELHAAAKHGHLEIVQLLVEHMSPPNNGDGDKRPCKRARRRDEPRPQAHVYYSSMLPEAAAGGHLEVVQWLFENLGKDSMNCKYDSTNGIAEAVANGHMEVAEWIYARTEANRSGFRDSWHGAERYRSAIERGNLEALEWLMERFPCRQFNRGNEDAAARLGRLDIFMWLREHFGKDSWGPYSIDIAAEHGNLDIVKWLHAQPGGQERCTEQAMDNAARNNHLHVVKWLHENRSEGCTTKAMDEAASFEMVAWLHEHRSEGCTTQAMDSAIKKGDLETLLFLHKYRSEGCTTYAANQWCGPSHPDVLRWLLATYPDTMTLSSSFGRSSSRAQ